MAHANVNLKNMRITPRTTKKPRSSRIGVGMEWAGERV